MGVGFGNGVSLSRLTGLPPIGSFTMMGWFFIAAHTDYQSFLAYGSTGVSDFYDVGVTGTEQFNVWNGTSETSGSSLVAAQWYHVTLTVTGTGTIGGCNAYLNGVLTLSIASAVNAAQQLTIGNDTSGEEMLSTSGAAQVKIFDRVLTRAEILKEMWIEKPVTRGLNSWFPLRTVGTAHLDYSGLNRHMTTTGTLTQQGYPPLVLPAVERTSFRRARAFLPLDANAGGGGGVAGKPFFFNRFVVGRGRAGGRAA